MISKTTASVFLGITTLTLLLLTACVPQTEEARITAINKRIAPEGYITKTHLYVNWPAYTVGDQVKEMEEVQGKERYKREPEYYQKVLLEPLKLKIPIAYVLSPHVDGELPKTEIERLSMGALLIRDYKILSVSLSTDELAKPAKPIFINIGSRMPKISSWPRKLMALESPDILIQLDTGIASIGMNIPI